MKFAVQSHTDHSKAQLQEIKETWLKIQINHMVYILFVCAYDNYA